MGLGYASQREIPLRRAAWRKADDQAHRPRRIGLCPCDARQSRQRGSARCQMQEFTARKFHRVPFALTENRCPSHRRRKSNVDYLEVR